MVPDLLGFRTFFRYDSRLVPTSEWITIAGMAMFTMQMSSFKFQAMISIALSDFVVHSIAICITIWLTEMEGFTRQWMPDFKLQLDLLKAGGRVLKPKSILLVFDNS